MTPLAFPTSSLRQHPCTSIACLALLIRALHIALLCALSRLPAFDRSHLVLTSSNVPGLRWDGIHFASIALRGYEHEQQLAFQPLWQGVLRVAGEGARALRGGLETNVDDVVWGGMGVSVVAWTGAAVMLYKLTAHLFRSHRFALVTTLLYLVPPSPVPSLPYTEPLYALFTFAGLYLLIVKKQYLASGFCFAAATGLRATGVFNVLTLAGVTMFCDVNPVQLSTKELLKRPITRGWRAYVPSILTVAPFLAFQWYAYESFCGGSAIASGVAQARPWCESKLPMVYGYVQGEYWNVGLFKYWTTAQLPNILLASPIFLVSFLGASTYLTPLIFPGRPLKASSHPALLVLYVHHVHMMALLLFASHTQIALRVCITDPVVWWNVASVAMEVPGAGTVDTAPEGDDKVERERGGRWKMTKVGRWWSGWTVVWGTISTVLWAGHYPPA